MVKARKIRKVFHSRPTIEGAGVYLKRAFGFSEAGMFDPFLLLDDFRSDVPEHYLKGFPWHPHRGIETITYVLRGDVEHGDSMGNKGIISSGDIQWMTAGNGIIHQEMPKGDSKGVMSGFQLWANLPKSHKMMDPRYRDIKNSQVPEITVNDGTKIKVICGKVQGVEGPAKDIVTGPQYIDVTIGPNSEFIHPVKKGYTVIAYVIEGRGYFCKEKKPFAYEAQGTNYFDIRRDAFIGDGALVLFGDGEEIIASTEDQGVRFLLMSGKPLGEPIAWYGPIVMNTQEELRIAFEEYNNDTFIKSGKLKASLPARR
jgi:hypothetical protein